jgi:hypothetical protein
VRLPTRKATLRDLLEADAPVVCVQGFRLFMSREIDRGDHFRLNDPVVQQHPEFFSLCIPVQELER